MRLLVLLPLLAGCFHRGGADPALTVERYRQANARDDGRAAYALLTVDLKKRIPETEFLSRWRALAGERQSQAAELGAQLPKITERADIELPDGSIASLVREAPAWRLVGPRPLALGAPTPAGAVTALVRSLEERDFAGLLAILGEPLRSVVEREIETRLTHLKAALGGGLEVDGERARLRYKSNYYIELRRENGRWRIVDFN